MNETGPHAEPLNKLTHSKHAWRNHVDEWSTFMHSFILHSSLTLGSPRPARFLAPVSPQGDGELRAGEFAKEKG